MQLLHMDRKTILSRGDSEPYIHWQFNTCAALALPSALIFQATPLPQISRHRKEVHRRHVLQSQASHPQVTPRVEKRHWFNIGGVLEKDLS